MSAPWALCELAVCSGAVGVGSLGTERKPQAHWWLGRGLVICVFNATAVHAWAGGKILPAVAASRHGLMTLSLVALLSVLLEKLLSPGT